MRWIRLIGSFIGQVISWGCIIAYIFGIPSPFDITDARRWIGAMMPTPVVIALCVAGIVVTGPLLWTSTWWWPRIALATKSRQHGSTDLRAQPTSNGSVSEIDNDLERFRACLPHVQRCRKLISPFTGTLGTVEIALQVLRIGSATFGEIATELEHLAKQLSGLGIQSPDIWGEEGNDSFDKVHLRLRVWSSHLARLEAKIHQEDLKGARFQQE